jgi:hypothetical protein
LTFELTATHLPAAFFTFSGTCEICFVFVPDGFVYVSVYIDFDVITEPLTIPVPEAFCLGRGGCGTDFRGPRGTTKPDLTTRFGCVAVGLGTGNGAT